MRIIMQKLRKLISHKVPCTSLDIGEREIKFVSLINPYWEMPQVMSVARYTTPKGILGDKFINEALLSEILEELVGQYGLAGTKIVSAIGGDKVITRHIILPKMTSKEIHKIIMMEAEKVMPLPLDELVVRYIVLDECELEGSKQIEILFAAAPRTLIYQYQALLYRFGLDLTALDLHAIALWRLYRNEIFISNDVTAILEIGAARTNLVIILRGKLKFSRILPVGGNLLTKSMAETYAIDSEKAQTLKEEKAIILNDNELVDTDASKIQMDLSLRDGLGELVKEIRRSLEFYLTRENVKPVSKIILSGGTSKLPGFDTFIGEALNLPANIVQASSIDFVESGELAFDPSLAVAYGLALREMQ